MDEYAEAAYKFITNGKSPRTELGVGGTLKAALAQVLRGAKGDPREAASRVGVTSRTWQRWAAGKQKPGPRAITSIRALQRRARLGPLREKRLRSRSGSRVVGYDVVATVSSDQRDRFLCIGLNLEQTHPDWFADIIEAYLAVDDDLMSERVLGAFEMYGGHFGMELDEFYSVTTEELSRKRKRKFR